VDAILAAFLAAALGVGEVLPPAAEPTEHCEYYVSQAAQQVLIVCEDRAEGEARPLSSRQDPPAEPGSGASPKTLSSPEDAAGR
jgi:hypothetical protein